MNYIPKYGEEQIKTGRLSKPAQWRTLHVQTSVNLLTLLLINQVFEIRRCTAFETESLLLFCFQAFDGVGEILIVGYLQFLRIDLDAVAVAVFIQAESGHCKAGVLMTALEQFAEHRVSTASGFVDNICIGGLLYS